MSQIFGHPRTVIDRSDQPTRGDPPGIRFPHNEYECTRCGRVEDISSSHDTIQLNCKTCGESI